MALKSGRVSFVRYRVLGAPPALRDEEFWAAINQNRFVDLTDATSEQEVAGWVGPRHLFDNRFTLDNLLKGSYLVFGVRVDKKTVPARLLKGRVDQEVEAWYEASAKGKIPARVKKEIVNGVKAELIQKVLPAVSLFEAAWHVRRNLVYFCNKSSRANDLFKQLFLDTFGGELELVTPFTRAASLMEAEWIDRLYGVKPSAFVPPPSFSEEDFA